MKFTFGFGLVTLGLAGSALAQSATAPEPAAYAPATSPAATPSVDGKPVAPEAPTRTGAEASATLETFTYAAEGDRLYLRRGQEQTAIDVPVGVKSATLHGNNLYLTHGTTTVSVYSYEDPARPKLTTLLTTGRGIATGVEVVGGKPWVVIVSQQAVPIEDLTSPLAANSGSNAIPQPGNGVSSPHHVNTQTNHTVDVVEPGTLELSAGRQLGVRVGDRFAIFRETSLGNGDNAFTGEELVAFAEVIAVKDQSSLAELSRTAVVHRGDVARPARADQTESNAYPVRVPHVGEFGGTLRPLINAGSPLGFGVLADVHGSYWGKGYFFSLMVQPLGLGWTDGGNVVSTSALVEGGYDGRAFSVGLGVGMSTVNGDMDSMLRSYKGEVSNDSGTQVIDTQETHSAFTLSQYVRLGARDGVNLSLRNLLLLHNSDSSESSGFIYGGTLGRLTIPLDRRNDIFLEGGGGVMGYWLAGAGVGTWIVGNGSPGSWKLSISAGAAGVWGTKQVTTITDTSTSSYDEDVELAGPMVAFGVTRRFEL